MPAYFLHYFFIWSTKHVMFSHMKLQIGINICHVMFLRCVLIKTHSSSLTNLESSTSSFCQSVKICCREEQREENNGNCKAFCVTRHASAIKRNECYFIEEIYQLKEKNLYSPKTERQQFSKQWSEATVKCNTNRYIPCKYRDNIYSKKELHCMS